MCTDLIIIFIMCRSFRVRNFGGELMRNGVARRDFANVQVHNVVTLATRIRIIIMKVLSISSFTLLHKVINVAVGRVLKQLY